MQWWLNWLVWALIGAIIGFVWGVVIGSFQSRSLSVFIGVGGALISGGVLRDLFWKSLPEGQTVSLLLLLVILGAVTWLFLAQIIDKVFEGVYDA